MDLVFGNVRRCIVHQFERVVDLTEDEVNLLMTLENNEREFQAGEELTRKGKYNNYFYTLQSGLACAIKTLADGQRQVLDIFLPGQIIGLQEIGLKNSFTEFRALTRLKAHPFPKQSLTKIFEQSPKLAKIFFTIMAREQAMLIERIVNISRRNAPERLAHFLVEMKMRLGSCACDFHLPINQSLIGDTLGISSVHVSRTLKHLRDLGLIDNKQGHIVIIDIDGLIKLSSFDSGYLETLAEWN